MGKMGQAGPLLLLQMHKYFISLICHFEHSLKLQLNECTNSLLLFLLTHHTFGQSCSSFSW